MAQITEWLKPYQSYNHPHMGRKTNKDFCNEVAKQVCKDPDRTAEIRTKQVGMNKGDIAVFTFLKKTEEQHEN